ncbi:MAG: molybdopterin-guanine dinucleotide biosynthesis protein A [Alphaproteobacteria bacterium]|nr:molybdopterin-guanine dinucleotide biosynthesis protein A [Alphaproteobacteria bacterium]
MRFRAMVLAAALAPWVLAAAGGAARAADRHAGYYYPQQVTTEEYVARAKALPVYDRKARLEFVNQLMLQVLGKPYPPQFVLYAKGDEAEKAILVAVSGDFAATLFRMRAFLAMMTTLSRQTELFKEFKVDDLFTFFDQLRMLGFEQLTVSDGKDYAHQITFK